MHTIGNNICIIDEKIMQSNVIKSYHQFGQNKKLKWVNLENMNFIRNGTQEIAVGLMVIRISE